MATFTNISLLISALILSVYAANPQFDHIFVFEGEKLTIDCTGGHQETILKYRKLADDADPTIYFFGDQQRDDAANGIVARKEGLNVFYEIAKANKSHGGEYECDWSKENDEMNHYVNIVDYDTLACPEFKNPVTAGEVIPDLECSISKAGTVIHDWLVNKTEHMGLDFTIVDSEGNPVEVEYDDTFDSIKARPVNFKLTKEQNGATLTCKFGSMHGNVTECKSNAAVVQWPASGLSVDAPDMAEIGKELVVQCDLDDAGNPEVNVTEPNITITPTKENGPVLNVSCQAGDITETKSIKLHLGPESIKSGNESVTFVEGESMSGLVCEVEGEVYPEEAKEIEYSLGDKKIELTELIAKPEFNGEEIVCKATNPVSGKQASSSIKINIKFKPMISGASTISVAEERDQAVVLQCSVSANPEPTYSWTFTQKDATNATKLEVTGSTIRIEKLSPEDVGIYACEATNEHGSASQTMELTEKESNAAVKNLLSTSLLTITWVFSTLLLQ